MIFIFKGDFGNIPGNTLKEKLQSAWIRLQTGVNCVVDSDLDKLAREKNPGIKQVSNGTDRTLLFYPSGH